MPTEHRREYMKQYMRTRRERERLEKLNNNNDTESGAETQEHITNKGLDLFNEKQFSQAILSESVRDDQHPRPTHSRRGGIKSIDIDYNLLVEVLDILYKFKQYKLRKKFLRFFMPGDS